MRFLPLVLLLACTSTASRKITCDTFSKQTSEADLVTQYGRDRVQTKTIELGEGQTQQGAVVDGIEFAWKDPAHTQLDFARLPNTMTTYDGIRIGTDLKTVEAINGRAFSLTGFMWDYSGTVTSWNHGLIDDKTRGRCRLLLRFDPGAIADEALRQRTLGDRDYNSASSDMQKLNPRVYEIKLLFY